MYLFTFDVFGKKREYRSSSNDVKKAMLIIRMMYKIKQEDIRNLKYEKILKNKL